MKRPSKDLQATLRAWRPTLPGEMASVAPEAARSAAQLVPAAFARFRLTDRLNEAAVLKAWAECVGPFWAKNSRPREFRNGVLVVTVSHSTLLSELRVYAKAQILKQLRQRFGAGRIREIAFRLEG